ncbi:MAG: Ldh family oxidoreductase [Candidatus Poribacteria bacterium]|nr:Ldh family oxidoreductase [Candidatus Poribacteria bacterium]
MGTTHCFQASHLHAITRQLLMAASTPRHIADEVAGILINANLAGHDSHGVLRLPGYLRSIEDGGLVPAAEPAFVNETANTVRVDGGHGFGHYTARKAMERGIEKTKEAAVCGMSLVRNEHIGRLGEYAEQAARAGRIGIITYGNGGRARGSTVPFGGAKGALGTNPISVGVPTGDDTPFIVDFATSVIAGGKIQFAHSRGADLPEGAIVDKHGNPSVKTADFYDGGSLLAFGLHKGYALSLLTCLLGGLSGTFDVEQGTMRGVFMQVINIDAFTPLETYQQGVRAFLDGIKSIPPAPGFDEVLVPGDFEQRSRLQRLADGIEVPDATYQQLQEWAEKSDASLSEETVEPADVQRYQVSGT